MKNFLIKLVIALILLQPAAGMLTHAATPNVFVYEGRLLDSSGAPETAAHTFRFSFWSSADYTSGDVTGAGAIDTGKPTYGGWQEVQTVTFGSNGTFSVKLGSVSALPNIDFAKHKYLQIEIKASGDPDTSYQLMDPTGDAGADTDDRETIGSLPYSKTAEGSNEETFKIDRDDTILNAATGSIKLQFGNALGKYLEYDYDNSQFNFNDNVQVSGNFIVTGDVNYSEATGFRIRENPDPASNSACSSVGELIYNTTDLKLQHCTAAGVAGAATWADVDGAGGGGHTQNTDTGSTTNTFTLDTDDTGGNIDLVFGNTVAEYLRHDGTLFHFSDDLRMDSESAVEFRDGDLAINSSVDGQLDIDADTELEITAPTVDLNGDLDVSGAITGATIDGDLNTLHNIDFSSLKTRTETILVTPVYPNMTIVEDGSDNVATLFEDYDSTGDRQYLTLTSNKGTLNDLDVYIAFQLPDDFVSFQATPLQIFIRSLTTSTADNQLDVTVTDTANAAVTLAGAADLVSSVADTWIEKDITFGGVPTFVAGDFMMVRLKLQAKSTGKMYVGEIKLNYNGR